MTFEDYLAGLTGPWLQEQGFRAYPLQLLYEEGPARLLSRSPLYARLKKLGIESLMYRIEGVLTAHLTEAQIAMVWHDINPSAPRPRILDEAGWVQPAPDLGRMVSPDAGAIVPQQDAGLATIETDVLPEQVTFEGMQQQLNLDRLSFEQRLEPARQWIACHEVLDKLASIQAELPTRTVADLLGMSVSQVRRLGAEDPQTYDPYDRYFRSHGHVIQRIPYQTGPTTLWWIRKEPVRNPQLLAQRDAEDEAASKAQELSGICAAEDIEAEGWGPISQDHPENRHL